ncbi:hypothetical protein OEA41_008919 [Lepraria neglecta]|uniref:Alcohol dehydrogenase n=1 Tax=Lepraria neglecta TaxID=209136 RepID=A0AAD9Z0V4_9LECA|nr:hypothetical protein OEA41_008919 [Lepraria neglecta]
MSSQELPKTHRALVVHSTDIPPNVETLPTPQPGPGVAIVRILAANVISFMRQIYNGERQYPYPKPLVPGTSAIGRVAAVGPDATSLKPGQLVHVDCLIRGRDDPDNVFLAGIHEGYTEGSKKLMHGEWKDSTYAEYAKVPLETCDVLDEKRLLSPLPEGGLGYEVEELAYISGLLVPFGGLKDIGLQAGETVIVSPATGGFGGAAVLVALAMGARVIAMGRDRAKLEKLREKVGGGRVEVVPMTGDVEADAKSLKKWGEVDAFFDISPPEAAKSTHIKSGILALRKGGRVSLMGGIREDVGVPHGRVMHWNLTLKGKWMYERDDIKSMIKMIEAGVLKVGKSGGLRVVGKFGLEDWDAAFTAAEKNAGMGDSTVIAP